ncbi:hypothetical protein Bpfe_007072 [Biomphalaria pfeifferi]|uniref:Uncharacterized protein n=1 Tax=Biomphalaria pfeifferi TaxID=112525 RepID=A0AAD8BZ06_BIOPF|nr:hypothetical protein Bpfe_007072 [Biomphalaria pfeifferi]
MSSKPHLEGFEFKAPLQREEIPANCVAIFKWDYNFFSRSPSKRFSDSSSWNNGPENYNSDRHDLCVRWLASATIVMKSQDKT